MVINIEDFKIILLQKSIDEIEEALRVFNLNSVDKFGSNILHYYVSNYTAIKVPVETIIELFIRFGIDINVTQLKMPKRTALHTAIIKKSKEPFDVLLKKGAGIDIKDGDGNVPLSDAVFAYRGDDSYFIETLISKGANADIQNNYGISPRELAKTIANYDTKKFFN